ncbi:MAG: hypothetical protein MJ252_03210 [archaeon]|nr:hypothetical protein [archaeon]
MGCKCSPANLDKGYINIDQLFNDEEGNPISKLNLTEYVKNMFKLINKIRTNPKEFAGIVEKLIKHIKTTESGQKIFDYHLKISLAKGEETFKEVAKELNELEPMDPLIFKDEIVIDVPNKEEELKDFNVFQNKVKEKVKETKLSDCFKDAIKDPEAALFMIIIDDTNKNSGRKRKAVLNKDYKYIGISSIKQGNTFCAYYTFAK